MKLVCIYNGIECNEWIGEISHHIIRTYFACHRSGTIIKHWRIKELFLYFALMNASSDTFEKFEEESEWLSIEEIEDVVRTSASWLFFSDFLRFKLFLGTKKSVWQSLEMLFIESAAEDVFFFPPLAKKWWRG